MKKESRTTNSSRNIVFSMIAYIVQIVLGFIVRRYFIFHFGTEYLGLNSLFSNVLSILSLAELGFGTAIVFSMYKPMAENDKEKVRELLQFYKKCYTIIGCIIFVVGLCVLPFMDYFQSKAPSVDVNLYLVYLIYLFNSVISYFFAYRRSLLYTSQRNDIESKVNMVLNIVSTLCQFLIIFFIQNYYLYILISGVISIINNLIICVVTQKLYPEYLQKPQSHLDPETKKAINKNIRAMIFHKIGTAIVFCTDSLIIYIILGSTELGKYSNYLLITSYVSSIFSIIVNSISGSVGNSISVQTPEQNRKLFNKLNFIYMWIVSFCTICIFSLSDPFIDIVLTKSDTENLILNEGVLIFICINFFLSSSRNMCNTFKSCAGLFYQDRFKPIVESVINLVASILLTYYFGIAGVVIGTIISTLSTSIWIEPRVLNKYYLKGSTCKYLLKQSYFALVTVLGCFVNSFVCSKIPNGGIVLLASKFAVSAILPNIILLICLCLLPEFKECINFVKSLIQKVIGKKKNQVSTISTPCQDIDGNGVLDVNEVVAIVDNKTNDIISIEKEQE